MSEELRATLLSIIQKNFPLHPTPFATIAKELGVSENEVIEELKYQKNTRIIRQISAIFDTKRLGYDSSLIAFKVSKENIDRAVDIINAHPGVSHNYERDHDFNIWFTLAIAPDSKLGLSKTVEILAQKSGADDAITLPTIKMFKIAVKLNTTGKDKKREKIKKRVYKDIELTPLHHQLIRYVQEDLPICREPFKDIVTKLDMSYERLFDMLNELQDAGIMRRFAAILNHRKAGFNANAMVVWDIDEESAEEIGKKAASFSAVSHCYLRPKYPNWQYNLFTMIHGKTKEETNGVIEEIASEISYNAKRPLYSTREFKKVRIKYFSDAFERWEREMLGETV